MTVQEVYLLTNFLSDKYQSRQISDDEFNIAMSSANLELFKTKVGIPEEYQVGQARARQEWQVTTKISDDMRKFVTEVEINKVGGVFPYPTNYGAFSSLRYSRILNNGCDTPDVRTRTIELVTDGELSDRLDNTVVYPDFEYPVGAWYSNGWKVFPKIIEKVDLTYLRIPVTPVRGYILDPATDLTTYDPLTSVQIEYPETLHIDFTYRVLKYLAINIREELLYEMANQRQISGQ